MRFECFPSLFFLRANFSRFTSSQSKWKICNANIHTQPGRQAASIFARLPLIKLGNEKKDHAELCPFLAHDAFHKTLSQAQHQHHLTNKAFPQLDRSPGGAHMWMVIYLPVGMPKITRSCTPMDINFSTLLLCESERAHKS